MRCKWERKREGWILKIQEKGVNLDQSEPWSRLDQLIIIYWEKSNVSGHLSRRWQGLHWKRRCFFWILLPLKALGHAIGSQIFSRCLSQGGNCEIPSKTDLEDFHRLLDTMEVLNFSLQDQDSIFRILSSILHLGNIYFEKYEVRGSTGTRRDDSFFQGEMFEPDLGPCRLTARKWPLCWAPRRSGS